MLNQVRMLCVLSAWVKSARSAEVKVDFSAARSVCEEAGALLQGL